MSLAIPLGQVLQVVTHGVIAFYQRPATLHHGTHQVGLGDGDTLAVHLHHEAVDGRIVEIYPTVGAALAELVVLRETVKAHLVVVVNERAHAHHQVVGCRVEDLSPRIRLLLLFLYFFTLGF